MVYGSSRADPGSNEYFTMPRSDWKKNEGGEGATTTSSGHILLGGQDNFLVIHYICNHIKRFIAIKIIFYFPSPLIG